MKRSLLVLLLSLLTSACITLTPELKKVAIHHTIMASPEGELVSPENYGDELSSDAQVKYMEDVLKHLNKYVKQNEPVKTPVKVLIFIHGGLNLSEHSILRAGCWTEAIMMGKEHPYPKCDEDNYKPNKDPDTLAPEGYFPVFINWRSFLLSSYGEHLFTTRQGKKWSRTFGIASSPFMFFGDVGRAISRAPMVWIHEIDTAIASFRGTHFLKVKPDVYKHYLKLKEKMESPDKNQIHISIGEDHGPPVTRFEDSEKSTQEKTYDGEILDGSLIEGGINTVIYFLTLPPKFLLSPIIDSGGKPSWDIMNRRTELLRHQPQDYVEVGPNRTGAVAKFLDEFVEFLHPEKGNPPNVEVTIIGHSMGTIIANWMIADYGDKLNLKNIVYMAAASKISDFERQVIPYLGSEAGKQTEFYNLTLHPRQEVRERNFFSLPPRGSLLMWIDNYLSSPEDFLDRTLGRWDNIIVATHIFPKKTRCRVHIKAFSVNEWSKSSKESPQKHGDFPNSTFWKEEFWNPKVEEHIKQECG